MADPRGATPWWDELSEYPSPLDVKRLRRDANDLLRACKIVAEMAVAWQALTPGDIEEVHAAIKKAEYRG